ncbi:MAG: hypothetical protein CSA81_12950 [Acidobacteria bacterium]|nr:MAG: hypothetical protein CSA81_12950 [Acidobacteriota bacterium]PIE89127.1 MAG: hypothetical protein CR997_12690 [Acidobacteriota bacterium]
MITDHQYRRLIKLKQTENHLALAASKAGMCEKTARKYLTSRILGHPQQFMHLVANPSCLIHA